MVYIATDTLRPIGSLIKNDLSKCYACSGASMPFVSKVSSRATSILVTYWRRRAARCLSPPVRPRARPRARVGRP